MSKAHMQSVSSIDTHNNVVEARSSGVLQLLRRMWLTVLRYMKVRRSEPVSGNVSEIIKLPDPKCPTPNGCVETINSLAPRS
jgi:hypothetical protein